MTSELTPRIKELCSLITQETDRQKFFRWSKSLTCFSKKERNRGSAMNLSTVALTLS